MFAHYLKIAFRSLGKYRMQNIISIVCLAVALFCFSINLYLTRFLVQEDGWLDDRVVFLTDVKGVMDVNFDLAKSMALQRPEVESIARFRMRSYAWQKAHDESVMEKRDYFIHTDYSMPDVLGLDLVAGDWQNVLNTNALHCLVLSESFAKKHFGSADQAIGQEINLRESGFDAPVQAVVQDLPYANSITNFGYAAGWIISKDEYLIKGYNGIAWLKVKKGVDIDSFCEAPYSIWLNDSTWISEQSSFADNNFNTGGGIKASRKSTGRPELELWQLSLAFLLSSLPGILILVVALFNYFHLLVNSILASRRDYALRRVNGASTLDMWKMVSVQIILTTILAGILSLVIARYVTPMISVSNAMDSGSSGAVTFYMNPDTIVRHTMQYIAMLIGVDILIAWLAVQKARYADMGIMVKRNFGGRNFMLGVQLTVAQLMVTLLVALLLKVKANIAEPYSWLSKEDKTCIISDINYHHYSTKIPPRYPSLESLPYITHVCLMPRMYLTSSGLLKTEYSTQSRYSDTDNDVYKVLISPEILDMLEVSIKEGRMPEKTNEILVDDKFINTMGLHIGDILRVRDLRSNYKAQDISGYDMPEFSEENDWVPLEIVGHIDDLLAKTDFQGSASTAPGVYFNWEIKNGYVTVRCLPGYQKETKAAIAGLYDIEQTDENIYASSRSLYDFICSTNSVWNSIGFIAWIVAIIAFVITLLGVYSAISIDTTRRSKEMALRKINGAKNHQITALLANLYVRLFIISSAISIPLSAWIINVTQIHLFSHVHSGIGSVGGYILLYLFILAVMAVFVTLTIGFKIHRIACQNPADVIKSE